MFFLYSTGPRSASSLRGAPSKLAEFYNHTLIGDNFFLELSHIDLQMQKAKSMEKMMNSKLLLSQQVMIVLSIFRR